MLVDDSLRLKIFSATQLHEMTGGNAIEICEDCRTFEVKQGPYAGDDDKVRLHPHGQDGCSQ